MRGPPGRVPRPPSTGVFFRSLRDHQAPARAGLGAGLGFGRCAGATELPAPVLPAWRAATQVGSEILPRSESSNFLLFGSDPGQP